MKKHILLAFGALLFGSALFGQTVEKELSITQLQRFMDNEFAPYETYEITILDNFLPEEITYEHINAFSTIMASNSSNKILGPIEYIYFDGTHSPKVFYDLKMRIAEAQDKYVCIDFTHSIYYTTWAGTVLTLPDNCFAGHENIYWIKMGSFTKNQIPDNFCSGCTNLQFIIMWDWSYVSPSAFSHVPETAILYNYMGVAKPLSSIHDLNLDKIEKWDYLSFTETDGDRLEGDSAPGKSYDVETIGQNFDDFLHEQKQNLDFMKIGFASDSEITTVAAIKNYVSTQEYDLPDLVKTFLKDYITNKNIDSYAVEGSDLDAVERSWFGPCNTLKDFDDETQIYIDLSDCIEIEKICKIGMEGKTKSGEIDKEVTLIYYQIIDGEFKINQIENGTLQNSIFWGIVIPEKN